MSSIKLKHSGGNSVSLNPPTSAPTSTEVAFKLPTSDGSAGQVLQTDGSGNLSWVTIAGGITEYDSWQISQDFTTDTSSPDYFNSNWVRHSLSNNLFEKIGTGLTESNGIFTFPSPGKYEIYGEWYMFANSITDSNVTGSIYATHNASAGSPTYSLVGRTAMSIQGNSERFYISTTCLIDVTSTSEVKMRMASDSSNGVTFGGGNDGTGKRTGFTIKKLAET
tara:strand:- start:7 stop:672 length:666 start_codon:yes stop_codon:yes gene_type:complete